MGRDRRPRMNPGVGYIGSGNKTSVFTRRSKLPFAKIKKVYGEELERLKQDQIQQNFSFKKLTEKERLEIKERVKDQIIKERRKELIIWIITFLLAFCFFAFVRYLILMK